MDNTRSAWTEPHDLFSATKSDDVDLVNALLESGADFNAKDELGYTALHWAAEMDSGSSARMLLEKGAAVNAKTRGGWTPLHKAAQSGSLAVALLLIHAKADVNARNRYGWTPLHKAVRSDNYEIAKALLQAGADKELVTMDKKTVFDLAAESSLQLRALLAGRRGDEEMTEEERSLGSEQGVAFGSPLNLTRTVTRSDLRARIEELEREVRGLRHNNAVLAKALERRANALSSKNGPMEAWSISESTSHETEPVVVSEEPKKQQQEQEQKKLPRNGAWECVVCMERPPDCVLVPCGHLCYCSVCAATELRRCEGFGPADSIGRGLTSVSGTKETWSCPLCRQLVWHVVRVYFPEE